MLTSKKQWQEQTYNRLISYILNPPALPEDFFVVMEEYGDCGWGILTNLEKSNNSA